MSRVQQLLFTTLWAVTSSVLAAPVVEATAIVDGDPARLGIACVVGMIVQSLTLITSGRSFSRLDRTKIKPRARLVNVAEVVLTGIAAAAVIGVLRGITHLELPIAGEFAVAAVAGSIGAEAVFKRLESRTLGLAEGGDHVAD